MNNFFEKEKAKALLVKYPKLAIALRAGLISRLLCRNILEITKWEMDDLYKELAAAGAIRIESTSAFRATDAMLGLMSEMNLI